MAESNRRAGLLAIVSLLFRSQRSYRGFILRFAIAFELTQQRTARNAQRLRRFPLIAAATLQRVKDNLTFQLIQVAIQGRLA